MESSEAPQTTPTPIETPTPAPTSVETPVAIPEATPATVVATPTTEASATKHWWEFWKSSNPTSSVPTQPDMSHELAATAAQPEQLVDSVAKLPTEMPTPVPASNMPDTKAA